MEHLMAFNRVMKGLIESKKYWRVNVKSVWYFRNTLLEIKKKYGVDFAIKDYLPALEVPMQVKTVKDLLLIIGGGGGEKNIEHRINLGHLLELFGFLEVLVDEAQKVLVSDEETWKDMSKMKNMNYFLETTKCLTDENRDEFWLAREVRNSYIQNNRRIDDQLLQKFKNARPGKNIHEITPFEFDEFEKWHDIVVEIAENLEKHINSKEK